MAGTARNNGVPSPPHGWARIKWLNPGFLWMLAAAGAGELLFTPRVGARYDYALLGAIVAATALAGLFFAGFAGIYVFQLMNP